MIRPSKRAANQLRSINITRGYTQYAPGSVLIEYGQTKVLCTATIADNVPHFLRDTRQGWVTAEYGMLPSATHTRTQREAAKGKQSNRTVEIQRLIGRSLRSIVDLTALGKMTITIDCDVIQADGGTRTAAITGGCIALIDALRFLQRRGQLQTDPLRYFIAAVSVGVYRGKPVLDLDYREDSAAETDMNVVMNEHGGFIEIQGTAEQQPFDQKTLDQLLSHAREGILQLIACQKEALNPAAVSRDDAV